MSLPSQGSSSSLRHRAVALHSLSLYVDMPPPCPSSFRLAQTSFESNLYLFKYPSNLVPVIFLVHMTSDDGIHSVPKCWHIKFRCQGIIQMKEYNIHNMVKVCNQEDLLCL